MDSLDRRQGLSSEQVAQRVRDGLSNADEGIKTNHFRKHVHIF